MSKKKLGSKPPVDVRLEVIDDAIFVTARRLRAESKDREVIAVCEALLTLEEQAQGIRAMVARCQGRTLTLGPIEDDPSGP